MKRWLSRLVDGFFAWCESVLNEPEERLDPPHAYYEPGTIGSYRLGDRCKYCGRRDPEMRPHTEHPCERPYKPELA